MKQVVRWQSFNSVCNVLGYQLCPLKVYWRVLSRPEGGTGSPPVRRRRGQRRHLEHGQSCWKVRNMHTCTHAHIYSCTCNQSYVQIQNWSFERRVLGRQKLWGWRTCQDGWDEELPVTKERVDLILICYLMDLSFWGTNWPSDSHYTLSFMKLTGPLNYGSELNGPFSKRIIKQET